jgi:tRNA dimethylallyltransferase
MADALVITGATATGKTALALDVAQRLNAEIISLDSRQVYRGMDIGTAKPTRAERELVAHHGLDLVTPAERYSAGKFASDARCWLEDIARRGKSAVLVGGTGFFLRSLTDPLFQEPPLPADRRRALDIYLSERSTDELLRWLAVLDPATAERLTQQGGRQRMLRALEIALLTGYPLGWWHRNAESGPPPISVLTFVLDLPRAVLNQRIDQRVLDMIDAGLVREVHDLMKEGHDERTPGMSATGYIELIPYLRGEVTLAAAIAQIQGATRRYARRQETWFRHQLPADVVRLDAQRDRSDLADEIVARWEREVSSENRN